MTNSLREIPDFNIVGRKLQGWAGRTVHELEVWSDPIESAERRSSRTRWVQNALWGWSGFLTGKSTIRWNVSSCREIGSCY
jgi:hypothetical protein